MFEIQETLNNPSLRNASNVTESVRDKSIRKTLYVSLLGFDVAAQEKLSRALQTKRADGFIYRLLDPTEEQFGAVILVNYDNPLAQKQIEAILALHPRLKRIAVSHGGIDDTSAHQLRGILITAKILGILDKVAEELAKEKPNQSDSPTQLFKPTSVPNEQPLTTRLDVPAEPILASAYSCPPVSPVAPSNEVAGYRALIVDDSIAIQKSLQLHLANIKQIAAVDFASSGEEAVDKCASQKYNVIFLDIIMPGIDGYDTCTLLRKMPAYKKVPIIMVSGKTSPLDEVKGVVAGCTTYLTKPVQPEAFQRLSNRVLTWLERQNPSNTP